MMTQELNVCVLSAPLAAIDRRALSQAWYSALHCASQRRCPQAGRSGKRTTEGGASDTPPRAMAADRARDRAAQRLPSPRETNAKPRRAISDVENDRRARGSLLARRIERKFLDPRCGAQRATFAAAGKRVHVLVQASGGRIRLVAVCSPALRETVTRALAQARFALVSRGVSCS